MAEDYGTGQFFEYMQKMWNPLGFPIPALLTPTVDPQELERRVGELRVVEHWLQANLNFVQMSVKALEMQKSALETMAAGAAATSRGPSGPGEG